MTSRPHKSRYEECCLSSLRSDREVDRKVRTHTRMPPSPLDVMYTLPNSSLTPQAPSRTAGRPRRAVPCGRLQSAFLPSGSPAFCLTRGRAGVMATGGGAPRTSLCRCHALRQRRRAWRRAAAQQPRGSHWTANFPKRRFCLPGARALSAAPPVRRASLERPRHLLRVALSRAAPRRARARGSARPARAPACKAHARTRARARGPAAPRPHPAGLCPPRQARGAGTGPLA